MDCGSPGSIVLSFDNRRISRSEMITSAPETIPARSSSEPMWSPCAWVSTMRTIGAPSRSASRTMRLALAKIIVSTTVKPSSSLTR